MTPDPITTAAEKLGREAGEAAASWYFDGNSTPETYQRVLCGIEEGDPEILDTFPSCNLSGEWADEPNGPQVYREIIEAATGEPYPEDESNIDRIVTEDDFTNVLDAYEAAFNDAVADSIETAARRKQVDA